MIRIVFRDGSDSGSEAHDLYGDDEYDDAKNSFQIAVRHWRKTEMILVNDEDPKDSVCLQDHERIPDKRGNEKRTGPCTCNRPCERGCPWFPSLMMNTEMVAAAKYYCDLQERYEEQENAKA